MIHRRRAFVNRSPAISAPVYIELLRHCLQSPLQSAAPTASPTSSVSLRLPPSPEGKALGTPTSFRARALPRGMSPSGGMCSAWMRAAIARVDILRGRGRISGALAPGVKKGFFPCQLPGERASFKHRAFRTFVRLHSRGKNPFSQPASCSVALSSPPSTFSCALKPEYIPQRL